MLIISYLYTITYSIAIVQFAIRPAFIDLYGLNGLLNVVSVYI